jgi:hypothetical protein
MLMVSEPSVSEPMIVLPSAAMIAGPDYYGRKRDDVAGRRRQREHQDDLGALGSPRASRLRSSDRGSSGVRRHPLQRLLRPGLNSTPLPWHSPAGGGAVHSINSGRLALTDLVVCVRMSSLARSMVMVTYRRHP